MYKRQVLGREVSLEEAGKIRKASGIEVELFVHGAMCTAYSGNCTISNYTSGRDSNRGGCVQSCRFYYSAIQDSHFKKNIKSENITDSNFTDSGNKKFNENIPGNKSVSLLSSKDLRGMRLLPKYIENGVDCIKAVSYTHLTLPTKA